MARAAVLWWSSASRLSHILVLAPLCAAAVPELEIYRTTPTSIAVRVKSSALAEAVGGVEGEEEESFEGRPWWWLVAQEEGTGDRLPWHFLRESFITGDFQTGVEHVGRPAYLFGSDYSDTAENDPTLGTLSHGSVAFRALSQTRCLNNSLPPPASFMPKVLAPIKTGYCVLELTMLKPSTKYRLSLFSIEDGRHVPTSEPENAFGKGRASTTTPFVSMAILRKALIGLCVLCMFAGTSLQLWLHKDALRGGVPKVEASDMPEEPMLATCDVDPAAPKLSQLKASDPLTVILSDVVKALTMFLPLIGPICFVIFSRITIGMRLAHIADVMKTQNAKVIGSGLSCRLLFARSVWAFAINLIMLPVNMYFAQMMCLTYGANWYNLIGIGQAANLSFTGFQRQYRCWQEASGLEIVGWFPGIVLSIVLLATRHTDKLLEAKLLHQKDRLLSMLQHTPKGNQLYTAICELVHSPFGDKSTIELGLLQRLIWLSLAFFFGLLPHLWMVVRHNVPFFMTNGVLWVTGVYFVNISGVTARFLEECHRIFLMYRRHLLQLALFQALSWQETKSTTFHDPFVTRAWAIQRARASLLEGEFKLKPLHLEDPAESKVWWHLREIMLNEMTADHLRCEIVVLFSIVYSLLAGAFCLVLMLGWNQVFSSVIVSAAMMSITVPFTYMVMKKRRDVNLMVGEHTDLLHGIVAEVNMPFRPQRPLDSHLQQERFLLQMATLIQRQAAPETVASFAITPQLFSTIVGLMLLVYGTMLIFLCRGLLQIFA